jgi:hypothetical protein
MAISAKNQITIVDLNDAKSVQVYFNVSKGMSQSYNPDTHVYSPNYLSTPNKITPKVYETGDPSDHLARCKNVKYTINGNPYTASSSNSSFSVGADGTLTVKANLMSNLNIIFEADYTDEDNIVSKIGSALTLMRNVSSGALFQLLITCPKANIFDKSVLGDLTAVAQAKRGGVDDNSNVTYTWYRYDIKSTSWVPVASGRANGKTLTVKQEDVLNFQTFKCVAKDTGGTDDTATAEALVTFEDMTDPFTLELFCPTGDKIVNGAGSTKINARVWQGGNKVEDENTPESSRMFNYKWTKLDKEGKAQNWSGTTSNVKTGNPVTVLAEEVNTKTTIICEIEKK